MLLIIIAALAVIVALQSGVIIGLARPMHRKFQARRAWYVDQEANCPPHLRGDLLIGAMPPTLLMHLLRSWGAHWHRILWRKGVRRIAGWARCHILRLPHKWRDYSYGWWGGVRFTQRFVCHHCRAKKTGRPPRCL